jgi:hypothetical protein
MFHLNPFVYFSGYIFWSWAIGMEIDGTPARFYVNFWCPNASLSHHYTYARLRLAMNKTLVSTAFSRKMAGSARRC